MTLNLILGSVGMGKSTLARSLLKQHPKQVIIDPRAEHAGNCVSNSLDEFFGFFENGNAQQAVSVVYRDMEDAEEYAPYLFPFLRKLRGWCVFVDEVDQYCNPHGWCCKDFRDLVNYRRHDGVDLIVVARRSAAIHRDLSALANKVYLFHTHDSRDCQYIRENLGEEYAVRCPTLAPYKYLEISLPDLTFLSE